MKHYSNKTAIKHIERAFPYFVEMAIPIGGFGNRLAVMFRWHYERGLDAMWGREHRDQNGRVYVRWCFADPEVAVVFANEFDGTIEQSN
jgi:hypothetical protein